MTLKPPFRWFFHWVQDICPEGANVREYSHKTQGDSGVASCPHQL